MGENLRDGSKFTQIMLAEDGVQTEADVESKVIWPMLTGANYLEIPVSSIKLKEYLQPTQIDKAAGKTAGYYPDFSVWGKAIPILIVEAKAPEVASEVGYREASLYARHLNQKYKTGLNPCRFIISCNGQRLLAGCWDSEPELNLSVLDIRIGSEQLERLRHLCHYRVIATHAAATLKKIRPREVIRPYTLVGGQPIINSKKPFNSFAAELAPVLRRYFTSTTQHIEREIYEKGYVSSEDTTNYDSILESLLKDRILARRGSLAQSLSPGRSKEPKLTAAIDEFREDRPVSGQLQMITGGVGSGKSLFARRYKELLQPPEQAVWLIPLSQGLPYLAAALSRSVILLVGLGARELSWRIPVAVFGTWWRSPQRQGALAGIGAADDVPIARRRMGGACGEPEYRFDEAYHI